MGRRDEAMAERFAPARAHQEQMNGRRDAALKRLHEVPLSSLTVGDLREIIRQSTQGLQSNYNWGGCSEHDVAFLEGLADRVGR